MEVPSLPSAEQPSSEILKEKSLATFVLTNVFPVITRIFQYLTYNSLSNACRVCRLWKTIADKELTKRIPFAIKMIDKDIDENLQKNENMDHFQSFIIDLMIRPDIVFCVRPYNDDEETLQVPCTLPCCTRFLNAIVSGIIGPINKNTASLEYESEENACSFLSLQYSEKFQFSLFKIDKVFSASTKDDFNNYCDRDVNNYIDPVILVFQCSKNIYVISQRFLNLVRKAFSPGDFSIVGGIATSLITKGPKEQSHEEKVAGLIIDGRNIYSDVLVHESNDRDELLSSFQTMKANILEKSNNEKIDLKHCFMLMISCVARGQDSYDDEENVECDIINKVFPGLPVFGFFGNGEIAYINNKSLETDEPVLSYTSVFCFIRLKDGIWR